MCKDGRKPLLSAINVLHPSRDTEGRVHWAYQDNNGQQCVHTAFSLEEWRRITTTACFGIFCPPIYQLAMFQVGRPASPQSVNIDAVLYGGGRRIPGGLTSSAHGVHPAWTLPTVLRLFERGMVATDHEYKRMVTRFSLEHSIFLKPETVTAMVEVLTPAGPKGLEAALAFPQHIPLGDGPFLELRIRAHLFAEPWLPPAGDKTPWETYRETYAGYAGKILLSRVLKSSVLEFERQDNASYPGVWKETPTYWLPCRSQQFWMFARDIFDREAVKPSLVTKTPSNIPEAAVVDKITASLINTTANA
jgi:hypothetical protein